MSLSKVIYALHLKALSGGREIVQRGGVGVSRTHVYRKLPRADRATV